MNQHKLRNKIAVVTAGARSIGRAICERYVAEGARLAVADIDLAEEQVTASMPGEPAFAVAWNVTKQESIDAMVDTVVKQAGGADILVRPAAIFDLGPLLEITPRS